MNGRQNLAYLDGTVVAIVLYEGMTALDAVGPMEVLRFVPGASVEFVAAGPAPCGPTR